MPKLIRNLSDSRAYYALREKKDAVVAKVFSPFMGVPADFLTSTGFLSGVVSIIFLNSSHLIFLCFWSVARFLDLIDGAFYRENSKTWFKNFNLDKYADITYDTLLSLAVIPQTGFLLATSSIAARFFHLKLERKNWANNLLSPHSGFTHFFFLFRRFKEGLILQMLYSLSVPLIKTKVLRK